MTLANGPLSKVELSELLKALGADRQKPTAYVAQTEQVLAAPAVFPLLHALETGTGGHNATETLTIGDWAARALLEGSILFLTVDGTRSWLSPVGARSAPDLPLIFHPAAFRASAVSVTPCGVW